MVWPHPLSLATTHRISFPAGTKMFHFPALPPHTLYIQVRVTRNNSGQVPPFGHPRITARLPTPRGLSQATTSFIGSACQGIHRTLLNTYKKTKDARVHYTILNHHTNTTPTRYNNRRNTQAQAAQDLLSHTPTACQPSYDKPLKTTTQPPG